MSSSQKAALQSQLAQAQKTLQTLELSQRARETLQKMFAMKEWRDLEKLAKKLSDAAQQGKNGNDTLTPEQIKKMQKELEDLAKKLNSDQAMRDYIQKLREAMKKAEGG
jgi:phage-related baseplate assembly protein